MGVGVRHGLKVQKSQEMKRRPYVNEDRKRKATSVGNLNDRNCFVGIHLFIFITCANPLLLMKLLLPLGTFVIR